MNEHRYHSEEKQKPALGWLYLIILCVCATMTLVVWYANEGRTATQTMANSAALTAAAPATLAPILAPSTSTSAVVTSVSNPVTLKAYVPSIKSAYKVMEDGSVRVMFQFSPESAAAAEQIAKDRGRMLVVDVRSAE